MKKFIKDYFWLTVALLSLAGSIAIWFWPTRPDPKLARIHELQRELAQVQTGSPMYEDRRQQLTQEIVAEIQSLSPAQKQVLWTQLRPIRIKEFKKFFVLPEKDQIAQLDKDIDLMEKRRAARQEQGVEPPPPPKNADRDRKAKLDMSTPEERSLAARYVKMLSKRRQERGLSAIDSMSANPFE